MAIKMCAVGLSGSPRHGNTEYIVKRVLSSWKKHVEVIEPKAKVELVHVSLANKNIMPCKSCGGCIRKGSMCILKDDWQEVISNLIDPVPDVLFIGTPVFFYGPCAQLRATLERCTSLLKKSWYPDHKVPIPDWSQTIAAALSVGIDRNGGQEHALSSIIHWLLTCGFLVVGGSPSEKGNSNYIGAATWECAAGFKGKNAVSEDKLGLDFIDALALRVARASILINRNKDN